MLLEVLMANPDGLRSGAVINHLSNQTASPMPQYMIDILIEASRNPGTARSLMEKNLSNLHLDMIRSHKRVTHAHLTDSVSGFHPDTLIKYFSSIKTLTGRYQQVFAFTGMNQYANAYAVMDTISFNYKLSSAQQSELNNTEDFVDFLKNIYDDGRNEAQLNSIEIDDLKDIADAQPGGSAAERAENILCFFYGQGADEVGAPKNNATKIKKPRISKETLEASLNSVNLAPNPGDSYIEFEYEIFKSSTENILRIVDIQGKPIHSWELGNNKKGIKTLDTRKLANGVYFLELLQEGTKIKSGKFVVQH